MISGTGGLITAQEVWLETNSRRGVGNNQITNSVDGSQDIEIGSNYGPKSTKKFV